MRILLDTNILLRFVNPDDREYGLIRAAVRSLIHRGDEGCFVPQSLVEFWSVSTRPLDKTGFGLRIAETDRRAMAIESKFDLLPDTERVHFEWRRLVVSHSDSGVQVHDARLVAATLAHDVPQILTLNPRDFQRYTEITVLHPSDVVAA